MDFVTNKVAINIYMLNMFMENKVGGNVKENFVIIIYGRCNKMMNLQVLKQRENLTQFTNNGGLGMVLCPSEGS